ncbi:MAG: ATP-dependent helicase [Candidatus Pacearchaeota archaeon]
MNYLSKTTGPCVILAGAGTGKTYSIVEKIKYLIEKKAYVPESIVCLTFSNEAVNTIRQRIFPFLKNNQEPLVMTFHAFCAEILRKHGDKIGISQNFKIILPDDGKILLHKYFKTHPQLCTKYIEEISIAKDLGHSVDTLSKKVNVSLSNIEELSKELEDLKFKVNTSHLKKISKEELDNLKSRKENVEEEVKQRKFIAAWRSYEKIKSLKIGLDYADLNHKALELLEKYPDVANEYLYIVIDEFQDTNKLQCELIKKIAPHRNITIVGDLNQSIYRFRGAYKDNFSYIKKELDIEDSDIFKLDKSYRSTNRILAVAHELIKNNYKIQSECFEVKSAYNDTGEKVKIYEVKNGNEEVRKIIEIIREELLKQTPLEEICVIFRTHQQANALKKELDYQNIPFINLNKESLLKSNLIKKIRSYLTLIDKYKNSSKGGDNALWEIMHLESLSKNDEIGFAKALRALNEKECLTKEVVDNGIKDISDTATNKLNAIIKIIKDLSSEKETNEVIKKLYQLLGFDVESCKDRPQDFLLLEKFNALAREFSETESKELGLFIHHLQTLDALNVSIDSPTLSKKGIRIMTNHATKGLEYTAVIMCSLVDKKFPLEHRNSSIIKMEEEGDSESQIAEERRLFYVGCTRAKKRLYMTFALEYGKRESTPSQFLKEINYQENENIELIKDESILFEEKKDIVPIVSADTLEPQTISFSASSLQKFDECQKRYEYKYVYNMPDPTPQSWESITLGNFVHRVLEEGVSRGLKTIKEFEDCAKEIHMREFSESNVEEANPMIKVFVERNKNRYNQNSLVEQSLSVNLEGLRFNGYADRIDISDDGDVTIVDYKTGKSEVKPKYRNWQLGLYAIAARKFGKPKALILEMLQKDHPLEFTIDSNGMAKEIHSARTFFSLPEVRKELVETAKAILQARQTGFKPCPAEKNCEFCAEWVYKK